MINDFIYINLLLLLLCKYRFKNVKDAKEALAKMNGFELAGRNVGFPFF